MKIVMQLCCGGSDRLQERNQNGVVHEFVDDASSFGQLRRVRRVGAIGHAKEAISNLSRNVYFARGAGDYVDLHQLLPPCTNPLPAVIRGGGVSEGLFVDGSIALSIKGEFERLHAVVLGEIGHKGTQGPWRRGGIEKNLVEGRWATRHVVSRR